MKKLKFISTVLMIFFVFGCSKDPIGFLEKGKKDFNAGHYLAAIDNLRHAKYFLPDNFEVALYLGKAFLNYNEDKDAKYKARYYFKKASELAQTSEEYFNVKLTLLSLYREKNRYSEIIETCIELLDNYKPLIKHKKEYEIKDMLAEAYFQTGSYDKAAALYQSIVTKHTEFLDDNPELHDMTNLRWTTTEILSDADDNIKEELDQIHSLKKCDYSSFSRNNKASAAICYRLLGSKLYKNDNYDDAIKFYNKSKELFVEINDRDQITKVSENLDQAYKKYDKNCKDYECRMREGNRLLSKTKYSKAVKAFKIALKNNETKQQEADALLHLGIAFFLDNKFSDALAEFEKLDNIYQKKRECVSDPDRLNLYYGASLILSSNKVGLIDKTYNGAIHILNIKSDGYDKKINLFKENIKNGQNKISLSFKVFEKEGDDKFREEIAEICLKVGDKFKKMEMVDEAKEFYQYSKKSYQYLGKKTRADKVKEELNSLSS